MKYLWCLLSFVGIWVGGYVAFHIDNQVFNESWWAHPLLITCMLVMSGLLVMAAFEIAEKIQSRL